MEVCLPEVGGSNGARSRRQSRPRSHSSEFGRSEVEGLTRNSTRAVLVASIGSNPSESTVGGRAGQTSHVIGSPSSETPQGGRRVSRTVREKKEAPVGHHVSEECYEAEDESGGKGSARGRRTSLESADGSPVKTPTLPRRGNTHTRRLPASRTCDVSHSGEWKAATATSPGARRRALVRSEEMVLERSHSCPKVAGRGRSVAGETPATATVACEFSKSQTCEPRRTPVADSSQIVYRRQVALARAQAREEARGERRGGGLAMFEIASEKFETQLRVASFEKLAPSDSSEVLTRRTVSCGRGQRKSADSLQSTWEKLNSLVMPVLVRETM